MKNLIKNILAFGIKKSEDKNFVNKWLFLGSISMIGVFVLFFLFTDELFTRPIFLVTGLACLSIIIIVASTTGFIMFLKSKEDEPAERLMGTILMTLALAPIMHLLIPISEPGALVIGVFISALVCFFATSWIKKKMGTISII